MKTKMLKQQFEEHLSKLIPNKTRADEAMNYSLLAGGKRIRPLILLNMLADLGIDVEKGMDCAAALEMIHTYSLIHDDLPAMDNDDFRRGRKTCHKAFDEATAILAGDGLLTKAFETVAGSNEYNDSQKARLVFELAKAAGHKGMIKGQVYDLENENKKDLTLERLKETEYRKTGELLTVPFICALIIADCEDRIEAFRETGMKLGLAFQIQDDVMDYTVSSAQLGKTTSDSQNEKTTYYTLLGEKAASELYNRLYEEVKDELNDYPKTKELIMTLTERSN